MKLFFKKLNVLLTLKDRKFLVFLLFFSIFISLIETLGVSAIMPFLAVVSDHTLIETNKYYKYIYEFFAFETSVDFIIFLGFVLIAFYIFRGIFNFLYLYALVTFSQTRYHLLAFRLFENYMGMPYKKFVNKNSSVLTKSLINEASNITSLFQSVLQIFTEVLVVIFIYCMFLYVDYKITLVITVVVILNAFIIVKTVSKTIKRKGVERAGLQAKYYEIINSSFANFKMIKLQVKDNVILQRFYEATKNYAKVGIITGTLKNSPKIIFEAISFSLVISLVIYLVFKYEENASSQIGVLSVFVLGLYRFMPSINRILDGYNNIMYQYRALEIVHNDLIYDSETIGKEQVEFQKTINVKALSFSYNEKTQVLNNVNLTINKGEKVAFVGESGSGKSTLIDIIIGLYKPCGGEIIVDGKLLTDDNIKSWRNKVGYIPQSVYLFDGTVGENIAFNNDYDEKRIIEALKKAKIYDFLETKDGLDTVVGEGGILLSGGQKQRIAIARALYTDPEILILDEATSALDYETEMEIMNEIYEISSDKTLMIIAHRLSTIEGCEKVFKVYNGQIICEK